MGILGVDLHKINDDNNFYKDDYETVIHVRLLPLLNKFEKRKVIKGKMSKELMPVAWHPTRWWDCSLPEVE